MNTTLEALAALTGATITQGDPGMVITGFNSIQEATAGDITFLGNSRYVPALQRSKASAVLTDEETADLPSHMGILRIKNPTGTFSRIIEKYGPKKRVFAPGIHPTALVSPEASLDATKVEVGPNAVVEAGAKVGAGTCLHAGAYVGEDAVLGEGCVVFANATIKDHCVLGNRVIIHSGAVIGTDGFGYEFKNGRHLKIDQVGIVQIDDDVEIGSCTTIDRARFGRTWIGEGTKIDNLVQIAHNVVIGKHCIIVAQVGIAGSTELGNYVTIAAQTGIVGHVKIGDQVTVLARSGVAKNLSGPASYVGFPARPLMEGRRILAAPARMPELLQRVRDMEQKIEELEKKLSGE